MEHAAPAAEAKVPGDPSAAAPDKRRRPWLLAALLCVVGFDLTVVGVVLLSLGGTPYYAVYGLAVLASAWLLAAGRAEGAWLYGAAFVVTVGWALWDVGLDGWRLAPRIAAPAALGVWLLAPRIRRQLTAGRWLQRLPNGWIVLPLALALGVGAGLALHALKAPPL